MPQEAVNAAFRVLCQLEPGNKCRRPYCRLLHPFVKEEKGIAIVIHYRPREGSPDVNAIGETMVRISLT